MDIERSELQMEPFRCREFCRPTSPSSAVAADGCLGKVCCLSLVRADYIGPPRGHGELLELLRGPDYRRSHRDRQHAGCRCQPGRLVSLRLRRTVTVGLERGRAGSGSDAVAAAERFRRRGGDGGRSAVAVTVSVSVPRGIQIGSGSGGGYKKLKYNIVHFCILVVCWYTIMM